MFAFFESPVQLLIVGMIVLLLFGNRLPSVMQSLGQGMEHYRRLPPREQRRLQDEQRRFWAWFDQQIAGVPFKWVIVGLTVVVFLFLAALLIRAH